MGTNYYLHRNACPHCKRAEEVLHIGKSSGGWCFGLHVVPEDGINNLDDWQKLFVGPNIIKDEYGTVFSPEEMIREITERTHKPRVEVPMFYDSWDGFHQSNHSCNGPNGLVRARIGQYCVGHGAGTWDLIPGEFS